MPLSGEAFGEDSEATKLRDPKYYEKLAEKSAELGQLSEQVDHVDADGEHGFRRSPKPESHDTGPDN